MQSEIMEMKEDGKISQFHDMCEVNIVTECEAKEAIEKLQNSTQRANFSCLQEETCSTLLDSENGNRSESKHVITMAVPKTISARLRNKYCELCDRLFARPSYLQRHMKLHANGKLPPFPPKPLTSDVISNSLPPPTYDLMDLVHAYGANSQANYRLLCCHLCSRTFDNGADYNDHMRKHSSDVCLRCNQCLIVFSSMGELQTHELEHRCREYACHTCDVFYRSVGSFVRHVHDVHGLVIGLPLESVEPLASEMNDAAQ